MKFDPEQIVVVSFMLYIGWVTTKVESVSVQVPSSTVKYHQPPGMGFGNGVINTFSKPAPPIGLPLGLTQV